MADLSMSANANYQLIQPLKDYILLRLAVGFRKGRIGIGDLTKSDWGVSNWSVIKKIFNFLFSIFSFSSQYNEEKNTEMVCQGLEPGAVGLKALTNPQGLGGCTNFLLLLNVIEQIHKTVK